MAAVLASLGLGATLAHAAVPLPPRRIDVLPPAAVKPQPLPPQTPVTAPPVTTPSAATPAANGPAGAAALPSSAPQTPEDTEVCDRLLAAGTVKAERLPPQDSGSGCAIAAPVRLSAIVLADGKAVALEPPAVVRCSLANAVADWIRQDLAPLLVKRGGGLVALAGTGGYQCRGRNRVQGAKLSEHATGDAIDILGFRTGDGRTASVAASIKDPAFFAQVKLTTCARFATVLGPGSDGYHNDNLHLDLEARRRGARLCRWQLL